MPISERLAARLQILAIQRARALVIALGIKQRAEAVDRGERVRMPISERLAAYLQRLAIQRARALVIALVS